VIGDSDFASNSFLPYVANGDLALAMVRWLARDEHATAVKSRIPAPPLILLTKPQMQGIFLIVVVLLPLSVIGLGSSCRSRQLACSASRRSASLGSR
jgi:hypothetical protein